MRQPPSDDLKTDIVYRPAQPPTPFGATAAVTPSHAGHASPPRPPALPAAALQAQAEHLKYRAGREALERRSMLRGLILLALLALVIGIAHAGWSRAFPAGWWRQW